MVMDGRDTIDRYRVLYRRYVSSKCHLKIETVRLVKTTQVRKQLQTAKIGEYSILSAAEMFQLQGKLGNIGLHGALSALGPNNHMSVLRVHNP